MKAEHFSADTRLLIRLFWKHRVRYLIIGGTAVIYHGYARLTGDVDFFFDQGRENVDRLWAALLEFWEGDVPALDGPDDLVKLEFVVQFGRPPNRIDLISTVGSLAFEEAWGRRVEESIELEGATVPVWIVDLADLRRTKAEAGRAKDLDDLEHLPEPG